jgi:ribosomal protein L31
MKKIIQCHSRRPVHISCSYCDETIETDSTIWYQELEDNGKFFGFQTYLDCCIDKVGAVIGWCNIEDYKRIVRYEILYGVKVAIIAGYKE